MPAGFVECPDPKNHKNPAEEPIAEDDSRKATARRNVEPCQDQAGPLSPRAVSRRSSQSRCFGTVRAFGASGGSLERASESLSTSREPPLIRTGPRGLEGFPCNVKEHIATFLGVLVHIVGEHGYKYSYLLPMSIFDQTNTRQ